MFGKTQEKPDEVKKKKKPEVIKTCLDVIPIRSYDRRLEAFALVDGSYMDILRIIPRDLNNIAEDELQMEIYNLTKIYKTVGCDLKFISMMFPLNLSRQKEVLLHHKHRAQDETRKLWLDRQLRELELAEKNVNTLHFYLFFFGANENEFIRNKELVQKYAAAGVQRLTEEISFPQKIQILQKIANMNTEIDLYSYKEENTLPVGEASFMEGE